MTHHMSRWAALFLLVIYMTACSSDAAPERVGVARSADTSGNITGSLGTIIVDPLPLNQGGSQPNGWHGSKVDLLVADAFAACSVPPDYKPDNPSAGTWLQWPVEPTLDPYLAQVYGWMGSAKCADTSSDSPLNGISATDVLHWWFVQRSVETFVKNGKTWTNTCVPNGTVANLQASGVSDDVLNDSSVAGQNPATVQAAARAVRRASVNVCIAKRLRMLAPGSAGGEVLLFSAADQRRLLETVVERTRIAMLQYAGLSIVLSLPGPTPSLPFTGFENRYIPTIQFWGGFNTQTLADMAEDFAFAVDLNIQATREMASLLGRSASAHLPRGGNPQTPQDEMWGYESWRERALALLYGGDPIAVNGDLSAPWQTWEPTPLLTLYPGMPVSGYSTPVIGDWPKADSEAYVRTDITEPQVDQLDKLARTYDALYLRADSQQNGDLAPNPDASTLRLYMAVEAGLRTDNCDTINNGTCKVYALSDIPVPDGSSAAHSYQSFDLWTQHRITPAHATLLARRTADYVGFRRAGLDVPGAMNVDGAGALVIGLRDENNQPRLYYHIPRNTTFHDKRAQQLAGLYTRFGRFHMPTVTGTQEDASYQGLQQAADELEGARRMGSIAALGAVRYGLLVAYNSAVKSKKDPTIDLLAKRLRILPLIDGAIGSAGFSVTAQEEPYAFPQNLFIERYMRQPSPSQGAFRWRAMVTTSAQDGWWDTANTSNYSFYATPGGPWAGNLVLYPNSQSFTQQLTLQALINSPGTVKGTLVGVTAPADFRATNFWEFQVDLPQAGYNQEWTFLVIRGPIKNPSGGSLPTQYALLGARMVLVNTQESVKLFGNTFTFAAPFDGHWTGLGGRLTQSMLQVMSKDAANAAQPAFDGFGFPMRWSPPTNPELFGANPGAGAVAHYLDRAQQAASEATTQVKDAIQTLLQQQEDQAALAAAVRKSAEVAQLEQRALCGDVRPQCDTSMVDVSINVQKIWDDFAFSMVPLHRGYSKAVSDCTTYAQQSLAVPPHQAADVEKRLDCLVLNMLSIIPPTFRLAKVVADHRFDASAPTFQDYEGGTFQKVLFAQWGALQTLQTSIRNMLLAEVAAEAKTDAFATKVEIDQQNWDNVKNGRCSPKELAKMVVSSSCDGLHWNDDSVGDTLLALGSAAGAAFNVKKQCKLTTTTQDNVPDSDLSWDDFESPSVSNGEGIGFSGGVSAGLAQGGFNTGSNGSVATPGPIPTGQRRQFCESVEQTLQADEAQAVAAAFEAYSGLADRAATFVQEVSGLLQSSADGAIQVEQTKLAAAKATLEVEQLAATQLSTLPIYRQVHSYDVWRAQALLDAARVAAIAARRAIESHYAVDLSKLLGPEAFVEAPVTWSDQVYLYDLSLPAAVGLDVGTAVPDGVYPNQVSDYVGNLTRFVDGFTVARPTAVATDDLDVLTLPGPVGLVTGGGASGANAGAAAAWSFECPSTNSSGTTWRALPGSGVPNDACLPDAASPTAARIAFSIDPWGRVDADVDQPPYRERYNARWTQFAVNIVGTGIMDCTKAADPNACYAQPYVRYEMTHSGPAWVTDWNQSWRVLGVPVGQIEGAKGLAAELWLDPLQNNFSKSYVSAVARDEFVDRPFGGEYEIRFDVGPEVQMSRIQRIQLLVQSSYWVKQQ